MEHLLAEIQYFILFATLKHLMERGSLPVETARWANGALAKTYGVLQLTL